MSTYTAASDFHSPAGLRDWLRQEISRCTGQSPLEINLQRPLHALGLSSVHVARLGGEIEERLAIEVDPVTFYDFESIEALCQALDEAHAYRATRLRGHAPLATDPQESPLPLQPPAPGQLDEDARLPPEIRLADGNSHRGIAPPRSILLTGATGYLGAFLLHEWMRQTPAHVVCLVRAASAQDGLDRVLANARRYGLESPTMRARISVVCGDLTAPWLGLGSAGFRALAADIDAIVHSAAAVHFVSSYAELKAANVDATATLLRLACADAPRPIPFHHVSTLGVHMSPHHDRRQPLLEDDPLRHAEGLPNGYEQSKYVADKLVWTAIHERGMPGAIYRPPLISGLSDGTYHKLDEFLPQALKACLQLGAFPALDTLLELAPVDYVSQAIVHIAHQPANLNRTYFVTHPDSRPVSELMAWHQQAGHAVHALDWDAWKQALLDLDRVQMRHNALYPFVGFIRTMSSVQACFPRFDARNFRQATRDLDCMPPPVLELMARYTRYFTDCGFYADLPAVSAR